MNTRTSLAHHLERAEELLGPAGAARFSPKRILAVMFILLMMVSSNLLALVSWPFRAARRRTVPTGEAQIPIVDVLESQHLEERALLVDVSADWCGPCLILDGVIQQFAARNSDVCIVKINATISSKEATRLSVVGFPTLILFSYGNEVGRHAGTLSVERLEKLASDCFRSSG